MSFEYKQTTWSLRDLFCSRDSEEIISAFEVLEQRVSVFETFRTKLSEDIPVHEFLEIIYSLETINHLAYRINGFVNLEFAADTQDQDVQAFMSHVQQTMANIENRTLFFSLWWKSLTDQAADRIIKETGDYRYWLEEMRHFKPHTLSEPEEKIINIKDTTGVRALENLYDSITNRYVYKIEIDGEQKELTRGELMVYARHSEPEIRAAAYQELYRVFSTDGPILGQMYQTLVRDWNNEQIDLRNFSTPMAARNLMNDISNDTVDILLDVCKRNITIFQRYFNLKARWLGINKLRRYDLYAPVVKVKKAYSYDKAVRLVLDSFLSFEPKMAELAKRVFDENHLDSEVRNGKIDGAFCLTATPDLTPWVLLNYQGRPEDVSTMAHELGHAIHSMLADHHSLFTQHASLPLAETASTFAEMVLTDRLLELENDQEIRQDILFRQVDNAYATIMRQAFFAIFECTAHNLVANGASIDELCDAYFENLNMQFGDSVEISDDFLWEWVSIPHIYHVPFYVYAYAFGQLLVFSLYQQYTEEGETFIPRYLEILNAGGSESPGKILSMAGIDIQSIDFWQGGFEVIRGLVDQLEALHDDTVNEKRISHL